MRLATFVFLLLLAVPASADQRFIVRTEAGSDGLGTITHVCRLVGCLVQYPLDGALGRLFLVSNSSDIHPEVFARFLAALAGIEDAEEDGSSRASASQVPEAPPALLDTRPTIYFGAPARRGYVEQPATRLLRLRQAQRAYGATGSGVTVAIIDTGIDPTHPALAAVVTEGYDFTRNRLGGSELPDVPARGPVRAARALPLNDRTLAVIDPLTAAALDEGDHGVFGHGTMVAGVVHLVAPRARLMPLKVFDSAGRAYTSDILRAIYVAAAKQARVINMSFSFRTLSRELARAVAYAQSRGSIVVASVGNDARRGEVYPAALPRVIGVAASTDTDAIAPFSNVGPDIAWVAAPGEAIVTTFPFGTYAAGWGTSFSAPFAAGAAALLAEVRSLASVAQAVDAQGHAVWISPDVKRGRLDIPAALAAIRAALPGR